MGILKAIVGKPKKTVLKKSRTAPATSISIKEAAKVPIAKISVKDTATEVKDPVPTVKEAAPIGTAKVKPAVAKSKRKK